MEGGEADDALQLPQVEIVQLSAAQPVEIGDRRRVEESADAVIDPGALDRQQPRQRHDDEQRQHDRPDELAAALGLSAEAQVTGDHHHLRDGAGINDLQDKAQRRVLLHPAEPAQPVESERAIRRRDGPVGERQAGGRHHIAEGAGRGEEGDELGRAMREIDDPFVRPPVAINGGDGSEHDECAGAAGEPDERETHAVMGQPHAVENQYEDDDEPSRPRARGHCDRSDPAPMRQAGWARAP